ncbi:uncharacterized protein DSM5745_04092 [Aspergillus mulundensis]|uniref:Uncharacterized protein n=1 Tax=Aspergillus mulundensis TaxID=1810919 RepID=A0A3D8SBS1_9EURO|nr:hypothetical protein DSM5745_04092 [Aspergillus mulundensis]RDW83766.1 hypothetical protein DSM5745_04092 [Aspergillus mulundensis]
MANISALIPELDAATIHTLLATAASKHSDIHALVTAAINSKQRAESARVLNFDHYSRSVWREINVTYSRLGGSKQYDKAFDVYNEVVDTIDTIVKSCGPLANPRTRFNGLSVLRKIGKTICLSSNDVVGHEVQKNFQWNESLENGMCEIIGAMSDEERRVIRDDVSSEEALWPKLVELEGLAQSYCVFPEFSRVLEVLTEGLYDDDDDQGEEWSEEEDTDEAEDEEIAHIPGQFSWPEKPLW